MTGTKPTWRTMVHSHGGDVDSRLRATIDDHLHLALGGFGGRIGQVHVRLYSQARETGPYTCHVRVEVLPSGGVALGEHASDLATAVARATARLAPAVRRGLESGCWPGSQVGAKQADRDTALRA